MYCFDVDVELVCCFGFVVVCFFECVEDESVFSVGDGCIEW